MKYTIEGFSQQESVRIGLDVKDLVLLRWIVDFHNTGAMEVHISDGKQWFWVKYDYLIRELPLLGITSPKVLARRMRHIETCGVLEFKCLEGAGCRTYFRFVEKALLALLSDTEKQTELFEKRNPNGGGFYPKVPGGSTQKYQGVLPKSGGYVDSSINDSSIIDKGALFEEAWLNYPNKVGKKEAKRHFFSSVLTKTDFKDIKSAIQNYKQSNRYAKGFIQDGKTFFNNWKDWVVLPESEKVHRTSEKKPFTAAPTQRGPSVAETDAYLESLKK